MADDYYFDCLCDSKNEVKEKLDIYKERPGKSHVLAVFELHSLSNASCCK